MPFVVEEISSNRRFIKAITELNSHQITYRLSGARKARITLKHKGQSH